MLKAPVLQKDAESIDQASEDIHICIREIELGKPLPALTAIDEKTGQYYQYARCLIRLHDHPLGMVELQFDRNELSADTYVQHIWQLLSSQINEHLRQDDLPTVTELNIDGLSSQELPFCIRERESFFATAPFVSIVISTRDRPEYVSTCLPPLLAQHYPHYEIILVDNAPSTTTTADLIQHNYSDASKLRYIREVRPGLSIGLNRGIAEARGEIVAFTDDDVVVDSYWLLQLVKAFDSANDINCVTGLVLAQELATSAQILFEEFGGFSKGFNRRIYDMKDNCPREPLYPYTAGRFGTGANMAFRSAFLKSIGGFDAALKCGMDIAAFFLVVKCGHKLVYEPAALVYHTHRRNYADLRKQIYSYGAAVTAYLTKSVIEHPQILLELITKIPNGLLFMLSSRSAKNQKKSTHYPKELTLLELKGMLSGPFDYIRRKQHLSNSAL